MLMIFAHIVLNLHRGVKYIEYKQECVMKSGIKVEVNQGETTALRIILIIDKWGCGAARCPVVSENTTSEKSFSIFIST